MDISILIIIILPLPGLQHHGSQGSLPESSDKQCRWKTKAATGNLDSLSYKMQIHKVILDGRGSMPNLNRRLGKRRTPSMLPKPQAFRPSSLSRLQGNI